MPGLFQEVKPFVTMKAAGETNSGIVAEGPSARRPRRDDSPTLTPRRVELGPKEVFVKGFLRLTPSPPTTRGTTKRGRSDEGSGPASALTEGGTSATATATASGDEMNSGGALACAADDVRNEVVLVMKAPLLPLP